jgi:hypothetical protein
MRQHVGEFFRRDYLEMAIVVFGVLVFAMAVFSTYVLVYSILSFGDSAGTFKASTSWLKGASGGAIALFGIVAGMCYIAAWALVGKRVARSVGSAIRARRHRA